MKAALNWGAAALVVVFWYTATAEAAVYRVVPSETDVFPGVLTTLSIEVETEAGDNVAGFGYFSFAIDLTLDGSAGAMGDDISDILINELDFDNLLAASTGFAQGYQYLGIAGVTTDLIAPTFGHDVGDVTWLFDFGLTVPATAELGDTITIMASEGDLENLIASTAFDNVAPQMFVPTTLTVVPEPSSATLCLVLAAMAIFKRRHA